MRNLVGIKAQDILIMLKLLVSPEASQKDLSNELGISQAEVSHGLRRLKASQLLSHEGKVIKEACQEFLIHALKYIFPAEFGSPSLGIPTAFAHPDFKFVVHDPREIYVWPNANGQKRGVSLVPFYPSLPEACKKDEELYKLASLVEMIRAGRARERKLAADEIKKFVDRRP